MRNSIAAPPSPITLEYLAALLESLDILLRREIVELRRRTRLVQGTGQAQEWQAFVISDGEADALVNSSELTDTLVAESGRNKLDELAQAFIATTKRIAEFETQAAARGEMLKFADLVSRFQLDTFERNALLIAFAPELDLKYGRLYAYLNDSIAKTRPTTDLMLRLLCPTARERLAARRVFDSFAPLSRWQLLSFPGDSPARSASLLERTWHVNDRIVEYLLGSDRVDARLEPLLYSEPVPDQSLALTEKAQVRNWASRWTAWKDGAPVILLYGRYGSGRRAVAQSLAGELKRPLVLLDAQELANGRPQDIPNLLKLAEREAMLTGSVVGWVNADAVLDSSGEAKDIRRVFIKVLATQRTPTLLLAERSWEPGAALAARPFVQFELGELTLAERRTLWTDRLNGSGELFSESELDVLAARYRLTRGQIQDSVLRAHTLAWSRGETGYQVSPQDVTFATRSQTQPALGAYARKILPRYGWQDIVLPPQPLETLQLICAVMRQRARVYGEWGLQKLSQGTGIVALFAGPSGTGKTMAAEIIAAELELDLFKIDLSAVVSKYVGETEKNLERIFGEAQDSSAILFFDEADALFGKRSEVRQAQDRYANIEVAYLLQRTEQYDGLVILTSNLKKNMDEAFLRRMHFAIEFPLPEERERLEIWRRAMPPAAPQAADIDLESLARKLKLTGGNIRNIVLAASFLAAEQGQPIGMRHLTRAANYEYQKIGKLMVESDFQFDPVRP